MRKQTDLAKVKQTARSLLFTDIHETEFSPVIVSHPFTDSGFVASPNADGEIGLLNITESDADQRRWREYMGKLIDGAKSAYEIYMMITKPYGLTFLKYTAQDLSQEDLSNILASAWTRAEAPNMDVNVSKAKLLSLFKQADPTVLMRYRGFIITSTPDSGIERYDRQSSQDVLCNGYYCQIYDGDDDQYANQLDDFCIAEGHEIKDCSYGELERGIARYVDDHYDDLVEEQQYYFAKRQSELIGRLVCWIGETESGEELYHTLSEVVGMKDDEIRAAGFTSLVPYFNREGYAQTIAEYLIDEGTNDTYSGNLHVPFSEINKRYGVNLPTDKEMLDLIRDALLEHGDIISDLETSEDFDMMFYTISSGTTRIRERYTVHGPRNPNISFR